MLNVWLGFFFIVVILFRKLVELLSIGEAVTYGLSLPLSVSWEQVSSKRFTVFQVLLKKRSQICVISAIAATLQVSGVTVGPGTKDSYSSQKEQFYTKPVFNNIIYIFKGKKNLSTNFCQGKLVLHKTLDVKKSTLLFYLSKKGKN